MDSNTCPASGSNTNDVFLFNMKHSQISNNYAQLITALTTIYSTTTFLLSYIFVVLGWPVSLVLRVFAIITISPIAWFYRLFVKTFETVITPIFTFAALAGFIGALGGLIVGGLALFVQWLIPISDKSVATRNDSIPDPKNKMPATFLTNSNSKANPNSNSKYTSSTTKGENEVLVYEDDDGYQAYTPRGVSSGLFPTTPPSDETISQYFGVIKEEDLSGNESFMYQRSAVVSSS